MAFVHGKNAQFGLRNAAGYWQDMTPYVTEVTLPGKAGTAETTVFGKGAKTFIGGLMEGQMTMKGFYDPTNTPTNAAGNGPDEVLAGLLGTQSSIGLTVVAQVTSQSNYGQFLLMPAGSTAAGGVALLGDCVITDYSLSNPVSNVVSFSATFALSGAPTLPLTYTAANQTAYATATYGLQVLRCVTADVFSSGWIVSSGGSATYAALLGTNK